jgi:hypothetical protein
MLHNSKSVSVLALIILVISGQNTSRASQDIYTRSEEFPALRMRYSDLEVILSKASQLATEANRQVVTSSNFVENLTKDFGKEFVDKAGQEFIEQERQKILRRFPSEEIVISTGSEKLSLAHHSPTKSDRLPDEAFALDYDYSFSFESAPVTRINILFRDFFRTLEVRGGSAEHVDAVMNTLKTDFLKHATSIGGYRFRSFAWLGVLLVFSISFPLAITLINHKRWVGWIWLALSGSLVLGAIFLPFERWLPGFAVYRDDPSFLVRYGPEIGFAGLLLGVIGIIISIFQLASEKPENQSSKRRAAKRKSKTQSESPAESK